MPPFAPPFSPPSASASRCLSRPHALLAASALLALSACAAPEDAFAPPCPRPSIPRDFNDLHRFRGAGRDITDSVLEGRITGVNGACARDGADTVVATVSISLELTRGPAAPDRTAEVGYFIAVSEGERILDKQVFRLKAEFPPNTERLRLTGDQVELRLPVSPDKTAAAYRISAGFDVTPAELEYNRQRAGR